MKYLLKTLKNLFRNLFLFILLTLVLSSCATLSGTSNKPSDEDRTGKGLEVTLSFDTSWLNVKRLDYTLTLKNSGSEPVVLRRDNFMLTTVQSNLESESVFTEESLENFYSKILESGEFTLYQNQEKIIKGSLYISDWYFKDLNKENFDYLLDISYDYSTKFSNNIDIDPIDVSISAQESVSQAAPIGITKLEFWPTEENNKYNIVYYISDKSSLGGSIEKIIRLKNPQIVVGVKSLSDCRGFYEVEGFKKTMEMSELRLNSDIKSIVLSCDIIIDSDEPYTTITSGSFEYTYYITKKGTIKLPKDRGEDSFY